MQFNSQSAPKKRHMQNLPVSRKMLLLDQSLIKEAFAEPGCSSENELSITGLFWGRYPIQQDFFQEESRLEPDGYPVV